MTSTPGVTFHAQGLLSEKQLAASEEKVNFTTLARTMVQNKVDWVDILKIDVEGCEWEIFVEMFDTKAPMPFTQILIEVHKPFIPESLGSKGEVAVRFFQGMAAAGYRLFSMEPNLAQVFIGDELFEFSFVKVDERGYFVTQ